MDRTWLDVCPATLSTNDYEDYLAELFVQEERHPGLHKKNGILKELDVMNVIFCTN